MNTSPWSELPSANALVALLQALPESCLLVSTSGELLALNSSARRLLLVADGEQARELGAYLELGSEELGDMLRRWARTSQPMPGSFTIREKGGRRQVVNAEGCLIAPRTQELPPIVMIRFWPRQEENPFTLLTQKIAELNQEIARRGRVEDALRLGETQLRERVAQAEALNRAKDELLASVSHELRTPLNAIMGWAALLKSHPDTASVTTGLAVILRNAEAQAKLIDDILDMARLVAGKLSLEIGRCNLAELVFDAVEAIKPAAQARQIRLNVDVPAASDQHGLAADPVRLRQVIGNLLSNAIKFSEPGGEVAISLERRETEFVIAVGDSGRGIDDAVLPLVFERFWQGDTSTARRCGGLGLGLAIVRHIVELHGGEVTASSAGAGRGAEFRVRLPASSLPVIANQSPEAPLALGSEALAGVRVLVLDDEPDHRDFMATVLARAGAEVQLAPSAGHALDYIVDFNPEVLVSDIAMPDEDGYRFIQQVRALDWPAAQTVPALAVTAYTRPEDRAAALARGFSAHLGKPVLPASLVLTVQGLVRAQRPRA